MELSARQHNEQQELRTRQQENMMEVYEEKKREDDPDQPARRHPQQPTRSSCPTTGKPKADAPPPTQASRPLKEQQLLHRVPSPPYSRRDSTATCWSYFLHSNILTKTSC